MRSGIYSLIQLSSGLQYIGSASYFPGRWSKHRRELSAGTHHNPHLQRAWLKHGPADFEFRILELADKADLIPVEQRWIDSFPFERLFNIRRDAASNAGVKMPAAYVERLRERMKQRGVSPAVREAQRIWRQTQVQTPEMNEKRRQAMLGLDRGPEFAEKMKAASGGRDPQWIQKTRAKLLQTWIVIAPDGTEHVVTDMKAFANDNGLLADKLYAVARGERPHHKSWRAKRR